MPEGKPLINISGPLVNLDTKGFSEPVKLLVKKVSDAIGLWYQPRHTIRQAKADAEASAIEQRAKYRLEYENVKHQQNMESITLKALEFMPDSAEGVEDVSEDRIAFFFDKARLVSDEQMQVLWAKLLAGEAEKPGSLSRRTIDIVSKLDAIDASAFSLLCGYAWDIHTDVFPIVIGNWVAHQIYVDNGCSYNLLKRLEHAGLVHVRDNTEVRYSVGGRTYVGCAYFDRRIIVSNAQLIKLPIGYVTFSLAGIELLRFSGRRAVDGFFDYATDYWKSNGFTIGCL
jgi:Protein of unknown function (DUF2806).